MDRHEDHPGLHGTAPATPLPLVPLIVTNSNMTIDIATTVVVTVLVVVIIKQSLAIAILAMTIVFCTIMSTVVIHRCSSDGHFSQLKTRFRKMTLLFVCSLCCSSYLTQVARCYSGYDSCIRIYSQKLRVVS